MTVQPRNMTDDSIGRALDHHVSERRIRKWAKHPDGGWLVYPNRDYLPERCKTKREIGLVLLGLTSASYAPEKEKVEA